MKVQLYKPDTVLDALRILIENEPKLLKCADKHGQTSLMWAVANGYEAIVKYLINAGAIIDDKTILIAIEVGKLDMVKVLIENKPALLEFADEYGQTPLFWAAANGHEAIVSYLISKGANLHVKTNDPNNDKRNGRTPLDWAIKRGHIGVIKLLLKIGAPYLKPISKIDDLDKETQSWLFLVKTLSTNCLPAMYNANSNDEEKTRLLLQKVFTLAKFLVEQINYLPNSFPKKNHLSQQLATLSSCTTMDLFVQQLKAVKRIVSKCDDKSVVGFIKFERLRTPDSRNEFNKTFEKESTRLKMN